MDPIAPQLSERELDILESAINKLAGLGVHSHVSLPAQTLTDLIKDVRYSRAIERHMVAYFNDLFWEVINDMAQKGVKVYPWGKPYGDMSDEEAVVGVADTKVSEQ